MRRLRPVLLELQLLCRQRVTQRSDFNTAKRTDTVAAFGRKPRKTSLVYCDRFTRIILWLHRGELVSYRLTKQHKLTLLNCEDSIYILAL